MNGPHGELGAWSPPVPDARYRFRIRARAMIDKTGPNAGKNDATRPDRHIILGEAFAMTDDAAADMAHVREYYAPYIGKNRGTT